MVAMMRRTYRVTAERDGRWWLVRVPEVPTAFTQVRRLDQAEAMARDVLSLLLDLPEDSFDVRVEPVVPPEIAQDLDEARRLRREAKEVAEQAGARVRHAARVLASEGLTVRDIGVILGVSYQRAQQLLAENSDHHAA
jgi:predicted RNase H-like HicB family nuclease